MPEILIVAPMEREIACLKRRLGYRSRLSSWTVASGCHAVGSCSFVVSGIGASRVEGCIEAVLTPGAYSSCLLIGLAAGLDPALAPGTLCSLRDACRPSEEPVVSGLHGKLCAKTSALSVSGLTVDNILSREEKLRLSGTAFQVADMESANFLAAARKNGVEAGVLRVVFDGPDEQIPSIRTDPVGRPKLSSALAFLAWRPLRLPALLALGRRADRAAEILAEAVLCFLEKR